MRDGSKPNGGRCLGARPTAVAAAPGSRQSPSPAWRVSELLVTVEHVPQDVPSASCLRWQTAFQAELGSYAETGLRQMENNLR